MQAAVTEHRFKRGDVIIAEGTLAEAVYVVESGEVEISATPESGGQLVVTRLGAGESFGEMAVVEEKPRSATVVAAVDCAVLKLPSRQFQALMEKHPVLCRSLSRQISRRLRDFTQQYIHEALESERLALLGKFARAIVHDIKNPLNIIGVSAQLLGEDDTPSEMRADCCKRIRRQVDRVLGRPRAVPVLALGASSSTGRASGSFKPLRCAWIGGSCDEMLDPARRLSRNGTSLRFLSGRAPDVEGRQ